MGFSSLSRILRETLTPTTPEEREREHQHRVRLATASILLETAYADESFSIKEEKKIVDYLTDRFELDENDARDLLETAEEHRANTIDHFATTNLLRQNTPLQERIEIVKELWRLVYGDGSLHHHENYLVRKLADLLGLEHHVMIEAKMEVQREMGREPG